MQLRVLVVDDLAEELPRVAIPEHIGAEGLQLLLLRLVLREHGLTPLSAPAVLDRRQGLGDRLTAGVPEEGVGDGVHLLVRVEASRI